MSFEMPAAEQEFADNQHGPPLVEQLHGLSNRTELVIGGSHGFTVASTALPGNTDFVLVGGGELA